VLTETARVWTGVLYFMPDRIRPRSCRQGIKRTEVLWVVAFISSK